MANKNLRLKLCRMAVGITQQELADMVGASSMDVCRWETNRSYPSPEMRRRVADALDCKTFLIWDR